MTAYDAFERIYKKEPPCRAFTPYRVCPVGAHVDHQLGKITGFAINKGIHIAYGPKKNGVVEIQSLQFPKRAQWHVASTPEVPEGDWADHLRGATISLYARYNLKVGLCAVIDGELPIGGLSSSAAVIITFLSALCGCRGVRWAFIRGSHDPHCRKTNQTTYLWLGFTDFLSGCVMEGWGTQCGGLAARLCALFILSIFYNIFMQISIVFSKKVAKYTKKTQIVC